jgi:hypothetical protein
MGLRKTDELGLDPEKLVGLIDAGFTAPDVVGTVEGWRVWKVAREVPLYGTAPKLHSESYDYYWAPRVKARATCNKHEAHNDADSAKRVPNETCTCGFYAAKTLDQLRGMHYPRYDEEGDRISVLGQMALWGKVIEGSQGWRAEFAYPARLWLPFEGFRLAKPLAKAYGVPVSLLNITDPAAQPDVLTLRPVKSPPEDFLLHEIPPCSNGVIGCQVEGEHTICDEVVCGWETPGCPAPGEHRRCFVDGEYMHPPSQRVRNEDEVDEDDLDD